MDADYDRTPLIPDGERLSHAYIAPGALADALVVAAVCQNRAKRPCMKCAHCDKALRGVHPDITVVDIPAKKREILVDQIRELKRDVIIVPAESEKKAYLINNADAMNVSAQNALLRILEEPPTSAVFILKTDTPSELLPTVRSRCVELKAKLERDDSQTAAVIDMTNEFFKAIMGGNATIVEFMFRLEKLEKEHFSAFIALAREKAAAELRARATGALHRQTNRVSAGRPAGTSPHTAGREPERSPARATSRATVTILSRLDQILLKASEYLDLNVGVGHISGMICASLITE